MSKRVTVPSANPASASKPRFYYGWIVAGACFLLTMTMAEAFWAFGVFFKPLESSFGWSRAIVSSGYTFLVLGYAISTFLAGHLADRYGPRPMLMLAAFFTLLGFSLNYWLESLAQFRLFMLISGIGIGFVGPIPAATITRWFWKWRGLMLGFRGAGVGVGSLIFIPLINYLISAFGWQQAFVMVGAIYAVIIIAAATVMVHSPEQRGLKPYGVGEGNPGHGGKGTVAAAYQPEMAMAGIVRTSTFWWLLVVLVLSQVPTQIIIVHFIPYAVDTGLTPALAAFAVGLLGVSSIPGRILGGAACDRIGWRRGYAFGLLGMGLAIVELLMVRSPATLYLFVVWYGVFNGMRNPAQLGLLAHFFGTRSMGKLVGLTQAIAMPISALGPYLAGFIYDSTGSYIIAIVLMAGLLLLTGSLVFLVKAPQPTGKPMSSST